jgi:hypothetical protein
VTVSERFRRGDDRAVPDRLVRCQRNHDGHNVNEIKMQDVKKQRHPAIHQQSVTQSALCFGSIKQSKQYE